MITFAEPSLLHDLSVFGWVDGCGEWIGLPSHAAPTLTSKWTELRGIHGHSTKHVPNEKFFVFI